MNMLVFIQSNSVATLTHYSLLFVFNKELLASVVTFTASRPAE